MYYALVVSFNTFSLVIVYRRLQQTNFKNIVAKEENTHHEQAHILSPCFKLYKYTFMFNGIPYFYLHILSKSPAADVLHMGKGLIC